MRGLNNPISNLSAYLATMLLLFRVVLGEPVLGIFAVGLMTCAAIVNFPATLSMIVRNSALTAGLAACLLVAIYNSTFYAGRPLVYVALGFVHVSVAWIAFREPAFALRLARHLLFIWAAIVLTLGVIKGFSPNEVNEWFPTGSRNVVGFVAISLQIFYSAANFAQHKKIAIFTPLLTLAICYLAFGRSGILIGLLLAAVSIWFWLWARSIIFRAICIPITIIIAGFVTIYYFENIILYVVENTNFGGRGLNSPRFDMWGEYWVTLTGINLLIGVDLNSLATLAEHGANPHNSFLRGYSYFGLPFVFLVAWILIRSTFAAKNAIFLYTMLFLFMIRAGADSLAFFESFDFVPLYVWMILINFRATQR